MLCLVIQSTKKSRNIDDDEIVVKCSYGRPPFAEKNGRLLNIGSVFYLMFFKS